jgi:phosphoesterase RecJ-like protein
MTDAHSELMTSISTIVPVLQSARRPLLTTHVNPDGDGLGSELALAEWFIGRGIVPTVINHSPTPAVYRFLDSRGLILPFDSARDSEAIADADLIVVVDTNNPERLRSMKESIINSTSTKIVIDHHLEPDGFANHYVIDDDATSTGEIIFRVLKSIPGTALTPAMATSLYAAIMTDTGSFRYPRVDPEIHRIVAELIECGANPVDIYARIFERWTSGRIHLLGEMLAGMTTKYDGRLACATITREMLATSGTLEEDTDNFTSYPMSIDGVVAGILFLELKDGVKISFRSKGDVPINELAKEFGGNGHKNAAGARLHDIRLDDVVKRAIAAAEKYLPYEK